jgi:hypothetical protein
MEQNKILKDLKKEEKQKKFISYQV